jgi:hypothetical protein
MITFTRTQDGTYAQSGDLATDVGRFQWLNDSGKWNGGWTVAPVTDLIAHMSRGGPYRYSSYRIIEATNPELIIKPTCASCGVIAGIDCQRACEYIFGRADVAESLPIQFNDDHQFSLSVSVVMDGKNFGNKKPKKFCFGSVRCAELLLMEHGYCKKSNGVIGNGERLLAFLGGAEVVKARKKRSPNKTYAARVFQNLKEVEART